MAGFWHLSHHQLRDPDGEVYAGARARFLEADTLNAIIVYQDYGLGTPHADPVVANAYGVFPPVFFDEDDGFYRQRISDANGVPIPGMDVGTLPIIGPGVGGGGSEVPVDENSLIKTGYPLWLPVSGSLSGFVRMNGRTIGPSGSGASERANADCEDLYLYAWNNFSDTFCPVTGGRGASAAVDWAGAKPIGTYDMRGRGPFGLDGMGNSRANAIADSLITTGADADTAAALAGTSTVALVQANLPSVNFTVNLASVTFQKTNLQTVAKPGSPNDTNITLPTGSFTDTAVGGSATAASGGSGTGVNKLPPLALGSWYWRL